MSRSPQRAYSPPRERFSPPPQDRDLPDDIKATTTSLFVGNLPFHFRDQDLKDICSKYGEVKSAKVLMRNGTSKGSGFVEYFDRAAAEVAMDKLKNNEIVENRKLRVDWDEGLENKRRLGPRRPEFSGRGRPPYEYRGGFGGGYRGGRRFSPYRGDYRGDYRGGDYRGGDYRGDYRGDRGYGRSRSPYRRSPPRRFSRSRSRSPQKRFNSNRMPPRRYSRSPHRN